MKTARDVLNLVEGEGTAFFKVGDVVSLDWDGPAWAEVTKVSRDAIAVRRTDKNGKAIGDDSLEIRADELDGVELHMRNRTSYYQ